jgi:hypothetical protein
MTDEQYDRARREAHDIGDAAGREAATWAEFADEAAARRYLILVEEGSPRLDEHEPDTSPMAGEYADDYSPRALVADVLAELELEPDELGELEAAELESHLADAFADAWHAAWRDAAVTRARELADLADDDAWAHFTAAIDRAYDSAGAYHGARARALAELAEAGASHAWGPLTRSRLAGTLHRPCQVVGCRVVSALDDDDEADDDDDRPVAMLAEPYDDEAE